MPHLTCIASIAIDVSRATEFFKAWITLMGWCLTSCTLHWQVHLRYGGRLYSKVISCCCLCKPLLWIRFTGSWRRVCLNVCAQYAFNSGADSVSLQKQVSSIHFSFAELVWMHVQYTFNSMHARFGGWMHMRLLVMVRRRGRQTRRLM